MPARPKNTGTWGVIKHYNACSVLTVYRDMYIEKHIQVLWKVYEQQFKARGPYDRSLFK